MLPRRSRSAGRCLGQDVAFVNSSSDFSEAGSEAQKGQGIHHIAPVSWITAEAHGYIGAHFKQKAATMADQEACNTWCALHKLPVRLHHVHGMQEVPPCRCILCHRQHTVGPVCTAWLRS